MNSYLHVFDDVIELLPDIAVNNMTSWSRERRRNKQIRSGGNKGFRKESNGKAVEGEGGAAVSDGLVRGLDGEREQAWGYLGESV